MISVSLEGVSDVVASVLSLPDKIGAKSSLDAAASSFAARLRAATPAGYSGKLRDSVIYSQESDVSVAVGYESGVETAGNESLDSVRAVRTKGKSVIQRKKWVQVSELETVLSETFDSYADEAVSMLEESMSSGLS